MQFHSLVIDDALTSFERARRWADTSTYEDAENPVDRVTYPGICRDLPEWFRSEVTEVASCATSEPVIRSIFLRLSTDGIHVPHQAHNDSSMGQYSLMIYLNRPEHCLGGTSLLRHKLLGMEHGPANERELEAWKLCHNVPEVWDKVFECPMRTNRAFIFDAGLMHRAEPVGGFGDSAANGRLVLTAFFS